jgi:choline kinase
MVPVGGVPLIDRMIRRLGEAGIEDVLVITGHKREVLEQHLADSDDPLARKATPVFNDRFADWGNFYSLLVAERALDGAGYVSLDADVLLDETMVPNLLAAQGPAVLAIDCRDGLGDEEMKARVNESGRIVELTKRMDPSLALGEFVGVERVDAELTAHVFAKLREVIQRGETHEYYERAYQYLLDEGTEFHYTDVAGCAWYEIDDAADLAAAEEVLARQQA